MNQRGRQKIRFGVFFVLAVVGLMVVPHYFPGSRAMAGSGPPAPELEPNLGWLNTDRPLRFGNELRGHVVLLDFWTYCCINCMHILPDLEYLENKYADEPFAVVGVHSAKFDEEGDRQSVRHAMQRYDIHHPVVIDDGRAIWKRFGVRSWPSLVLIGADGNIIGIASGEGNRDLLDEQIAAALNEARQSKTIAKERFEIRPDAEVRSASGLRYPGKVRGVPPTSDGDEGWLFVSDSSNDRVICATYPDESGRSRLIAIVGSGERGFADGTPETASFNDPQGLAFDPEKNVLYVADTKNHAIRIVDLKSFAVDTLVGTGHQGYDRRGGRAGDAQALASPWDVELSADGRRLFIAMAGTHQLWDLDLETRVARLLAGSSYENIIDGPAMDAQLAQPSGLSLSGDAKTLYFADSETSSIRALDLGESREDGIIRTLIGTGLFDFGDIDGLYPSARLQHPLGVAVWTQDSGDRLLIADTYNSKIKILNPDERVIGTWLGAGSAGGDSAVDLDLDEPGGIDLAGAQGDEARLFIADTNHHRVVMVGVPGRVWHEVVIDGLSTGLDAGEVDALERTISVDASGDVSLVLNAELPAGAKANPEYPMQVRIEREGTGEAILQHTLASAKLPMEFLLPAGAIRKGDRLRIDLSFGYCFEDAGVCVPAELAWIVSVRAGEDSRAELRAQIR